MLAIIPARSGSKGLLGKNIKKLLGKPLIAYTVEAALQSKEITEVIISTDDEEIASIAVEFGAKCPFLRPSELATDSSIAADSYIYTIDRLMKDNSSSIDNVVILQPTSPLRLSTDIDESINLFTEKEADSVISFTEEAHPISWHKHISDDNKIENIFQEKAENRQEYRKTYYPNGSVYVFKYNLLKEKIYYTDNSYAYIMPRNRSIDIDYLEDFEYVEYLMQSVKK